MALQQTLSMYSSGPSIVNGHGNRGPLEEFRICGASRTAIWWLVLYEEGQSRAGLVMLLGIVLRMPVEVTRRR